MKRNLVFFFLAVLLAVGLFLFHTGFHPKFPAFLIDQPTPTFATDLQEKWSSNGYRTYTSSMYLKHENATRTLRENLLEHERYMIAFFTGDGFTNGFVAISNQIYVSILASRVPVLHPFAPGHLPWEAGFLPVSEVFDLGRWARAIHTDILELEQIKNAPHESDKEQFGCWSIWTASDPKEAKPAGNPFVGRFKLDLSWTPLPREARLHPTGRDEDRHVLYSFLAHVSFPWGRKQVLSNLPPPDPASEHPNVSPALIPSPDGNLNLPDEQVLCFDTMYYTSTNVGSEWWRHWSPAWNIVGKYARWATPIRSMARSAVAKALGIDPKDLMQPSIGDADYNEKDGVGDHTTLEEWDERDRILHPFIMVHARHGDFKVVCGGKDCFLPLDDLAAAVKHVQEELRQKKGIRVRDGDVIITSDETRNEWWDQVRTMGWKRIDSGLGSEVHGKDLWYEMLIELVAQGWGTGFVGTRGSTMSLMGERRTVHWQKGVAVEVNWGPWGSGICETGPQFEFS